MKEMAVYLMLILGGNASPSKSDVATALNAVGIEADEARLTQLLADVEGKDLSELLESGKSQLAKFGGGGGGGGAGGGGGGGGGGDAAAAEEKEEEVEEEAEAPTGGGGLFGDGAGGGGDY